MMDWTDRHCRYFLRGFSPSLLLYTEMITALAILRGDRERLLRFDPAEHPLALQLGGNDAAQLAAAARLGADAGYDEINLNCGCPSDKVRDGAFGACLMREPSRVADAVAAMAAAVSLPVTVKMRIGTVDGTVGNRQSIAAAVAGFSEADYASLHDFVTRIASAGCQVMIVHARKAVLGGYSPKDNREIPPLRYDVVRKLRGDFPSQQFILNGGLRTASQVLAALEWCDGVMLGREAYHRPQVLTEIESALQLRKGGTSAAPPSNAALLERMADYAEREMARGERLSAITRHMLGLLSGRPGAREFRRLLSEGARAPGADASLLRRALALAA
jgi:tRNA-dihydrouridine synthase A